MFNCNQQRPFQIKNTSICPIPNLKCITEFPFLDNTFDAVTELEILQKLGCKTNEIINFLNNILEQKLVEYIDKRFNDIMIDAMYDAETETLILYIKDNANPREGGEY